VADDAAAKPEVEAKAAQGPAPASEEPPESTVHKDGANEPTRAQSEAGSLTGKLIMPSADQASKRETASVAPGQKPPRLNKGEVYVDERGNVVIGE
jgi:hypothetical protein